MNPICVPCERFFRVKKTGFHFMEGMPTSNDAPPGRKEPENWKPYKLWVGDLFECPECGSQVVSGFGLGPIREHYQEDFEETRRLLMAELQVNDCC